MVKIYFQSIKYISYVISRYQDLLCLTLVRCIHDNYKLTISIYIVDFIVYYVIIYPKIKNTLYVLDYFAIWTICPCLPSQNGQRSLDECPCLSINAG